MFDGVEVWRVRRPLEAVDSVCANPTLHQSAAVLRIIVLLEVPLTDRPEFASRLQQVLVEDVLHEGLLQILRE